MDVELFQLISACKHLFYINEKIYLCDGKYSSPLREVWYFQMHYIVDI